jgi:integrase
MSYTRHGPQCHNQNIPRNRVWKPTVRALDGVPGRLRFHDLRHAFATLLNADGVPFREITALLGQSSSGETERYVHRLPDQFLARRARVAITLFPPAGQRRPGT